tara:strand:+ start:218 stop:442 length:225 start_codon:yes stop_codon:yes gene_type:complete
VACHFSLRGAIQGRRGLRETDSGNAGNGDSVFAVERLHRRMTPTTLGDLMDRCWDRLKAKKAKDAADRKEAKDA